MPRTFKITNGTDEVDLIDTDATGLIAQRHGFGDVTIPVGVREGNRVVEQWVFNLKGSSHDNLATQLQTLTKLIREAKEFSMNTWRKKPVYLQQQTTNETNARYAQVFEMMEYTIPDPFDLPTEANNEIEGMQMTIVREHPWRSAAPGTIGTQVALTESDGPTAPNMVEVANFRDNIDLTHVFHFDDSASTYSSNLISASNNTELFPSTPAANDYLLFGSTDFAFKHVNVGIGTAGVYSWDTKLQYWNGSAWTDMTLGTDYTVFRASGGEVTDDDSFFKNEGLWMINIFPPSDWATTSENSQTAHWVRILIVSVSSTTTVPAKNADDIYDQHAPTAEIPSSSLGGDSSPLVLLRMWGPSGGDNNESAANISRVLIGAKESDSEFTSHLNAGGNDNPGDWATAQGTDATSTADVQAPGGAHSAVDFATDTTLVRRVRFTGTELVDHYEGEYLVILRLKQVGGSAGDTEWQVRARLGGTNADEAQFKTETIATNGADVGLEAIAFEKPLRVPFTRAYNADTLTELDLVLEIFGRRASGTSTAEIHDLILLPIDEGVVGYDDNNTGDTDGTTALRGGTVLDGDPGVIANRAVKYRLNASGALVPAQPWAIMGDHIPFEKLTTNTTLYFVFLGYPSAGTWGDEPLVSDLGQAVAFEAYSHDRFAVLRGAG